MESCLNVTYSQLVTWLEHEVGEAKALEKSFEAVFLKSCLAITIPKPLDL